MKFILSSDVAQEVTENIADSMNSKVQFFTWDMLIDYFQDSMPTVLNFLVKLIIVIIVFLVGRRLIKVVRKFIRKFLGRTNLDEGVKQFFDHLANVGLHFILIMIILGRFGITASSVIAVIGCGAVHRPGAAGFPVQFCRRCADPSAETLCGGRLYPRG